MLLALFIFGNEFVITTTYQIRSEKVDDNLDGFTIVLLSDLHNKGFLAGQHRLIQAVGDCNPDIICITGDMINSNNGNHDNLFNLLQSVKDIAPVYYVLGNAEMEIGNSHPEKLQQLFQMLEGLNVTILTNDETVISYNGSAITLMGATWHEEENLFKHSQNLKNFTIYLNHYPYALWTASNYDVDLILSGHTHGGEIQLPFLGGLYVPDLGFFPEMDCGHFEQNGTQLIISSGLSSNGFPKRVNNLPEVVQIMLKSN